MKIIYIILIILMSSLAYAEKVEVEIADNVKVEIIKSTGIQSLVTTNQETKK